MSSLVQAVNEFYMKKHYPLLDKDGIDRIHAAFDRAFHNLLPTLSTIRVKELVPELERMLDMLEAKLEKKVQGTGWSSDEICYILEIVSAIERDMGIRSLLKDCPNMPPDLSDGELCVNEMLSETDFPKVMCLVKKSFYLDAKERVETMQADLAKVVQNNSTEQLIRFLSEYDITVKQAQQG